MTAITDLFIIDITECLKNPANCRNCELIEYFSTKDNQEPIIK
jgi:hypothetical protein